MKTRVLTVISVLLGFLCGWIGARILSQRQFAWRQADLREQLRYDNKQWQDHVKSLRQEIHKEVYIEESPVNEAKLAAFVPSKSTEFIALSYVGGLGNSDVHLNLYGDGSLYSEVRGSRQLILMLAHEKCKQFFHRVLTSGILNYSEGIVSLKVQVRIADSKTAQYVTDRARTQIRISIPELKVEKAISVYAPDVEHENYPDIIEFQIITQIETEILELVPKDYPLWGENEATNGTRNRARLEN